jgi:hypothetical protein
MTGQSFDLLGQGDTNMCARKSDDTVWCWGDNQYGALGAAATVSKSYVPLPVSGL